MKKEERFKRMEKERSHRRWSGSPEGKPAHFFKFILPTTILDKKLRLPMKFVKEHGDDLSSIVTLYDPNLREWKMGLEKSESDVWFCDGWEKFVEYYSITCQNFLVFRYEGNSKFHVLLFDVSGSEIPYPENPNPKVEPHEDDVVLLESSENNDHDYQWDNVHDNDDYHYTEEEEYYTDRGDHGENDDSATYYSSSSPSRSPPPFSPKGRGFTKFTDTRSKRERDRDRGRDRRREKEYSPSSRFRSQRKRKRQVSESEYPESDEEAEEGGGSRRSKGGEHRRCREGRSGYRVKKQSVEWVRTETLKSKQYKKRKISPKERDMVMRAARAFRSEFPSFRSVLRPHNLYNSFVYVPAPFAAKYLDGGSEIIRLERSDRRNRKQWLARCLNRNASGGGKSIGKGWAKFAMDNHLQEGDVCVFQLVKRTKIVLRVKMFRVNDYK